MKKICLPLLYLSVFISCKSKSETEKGKESIQKTLRTYVSGQLTEIDSTATLDSIRIIHIDTISSKDELKQNILSIQGDFEYLYEKVKKETEIIKLKNDQYRLLIYMNSLGSSRSDLSIFKDDLKEKQEEVQQSIDKLTVLEKQIDSLKTKYFSNQVDSTNFLYYGVIYKMCYSDKKLEQKCLDSAFLNITKEFRVTKETH